jgi:hypothetical protein
MCCWPAGNFVSVCATPCSRLAPVDPWLLAHVSSFRLCHVKYAGLGSCCVWLSFSASCCWSVLYFAVGARGCELGPGSMAGAREWNPNGLGAPSSRDPPATGAAYWVSDPLVRRLPGSSRNAAGSVPSLACPFRFFPRLLPLGFAVERCLYKCK